MNGNGSNIYYVSPKLKSIGFKAKHAEFLVTDWEKEAQGTTISPYALVNLEAATVYGMKVNE